MNDISVITLVKNRADHLDRLLDGIRTSDMPPREIVIVDMGDVPVLPQLIGVATKIVPLASDGLPLAAARNRGAQAACGRHLLFLDVDCIPRRNLIAMMHQALADHDRLICAEVRYLGPLADRSTSDEDLVDASAIHPHRTFPTCGLRHEPNAGLFWSLLFGIRRERFFGLQGFDEGYEGYGAEDTDFGFRARDAGLKLMFMGGTGAFHQYHSVISPPLQHFADIVRNANRFYRRWHVWPMQDWLSAFESRGLVAMSDEGVVLLRYPTQPEIEAARMPPTAYF